MRGEIDGLLVQSGLTVDMLSHLQEDTGFGDRPVVSLTAPIDGCPAVLRDERLGGKLAMAHLLELGHRRMLHLSKGGRGYPETARLDGYRDACREAGISFDECLIPVQLTHDHLAEEPLRAAVEAHPEATALLAHNDPVAIMACYALQGMGKRIPEDISVVGWDDTDPFPDANGNNQLTSVGFDLIELGRRAARYLIDRLEDRPDGGAPAAIQPQLQVRGSTAPPCAKNGYRQSILGR